MKQANRAARMVAVIITLAAGATAQAPAGVHGPAAPAVTAAELRQLRLELLALRLELQESRISELQYQLQELRAEQQRLQHDIQIQQQSLAEVDRALASSGMTKEDQEELDNRRTELTTERLDPLRQRLALADRKQSDVHARMEREVQRWQVLFQLRTTLDRT